MKLINNQCLEEKKSLYQFKSTNVEMNAARYIADIAIRH